MSGRDKPDGAGKVTSQKPAVYADEKSDNSVVPEKLSNNGLCSAETMEERELAKGNSEQPSAPPGRRAGQVRCQGCSLYVKQLGEIAG